MKNEAIVKINKVGKVSGIVILIVKIILIIAIVGTLAGIISVAMLPSDLFTAKIAGKANVTVDLSKFTTDLSEMNLPDEISSAISLNGTKFHITDYSVQGSKIHILANGNVADLNMHMVMGIMIAGIIDLIMVFITLMMAGFLAKAFYKCVTPFEDQVIKSMKYFAISLIPWAFITMITNAITSYYLSGSNNFSFVIDFNIVFIVLVIFALTYIFKYGAQLQKESDETL